MKSGSVNTVRKKMVRRGIIALILIATAMGGRWYARVQAARILKTCFHGSLEINDTEAVLYALRYYPELGGAEYTVWLPRRNCGREAQPPRTWEYSLTPLHRAVQLGNLRVMKALLGVPINSNAKPKKISAWL